MAKLALTIIVSIILTTIIISLVNVGTSLFLDKPEYKDYCDVYEWRGEAPPPEEANKLKECEREYRDSMKPYNQFRYYIFAGLGFIILLVGLFSKEYIIQFTGLASGGILVTQGVVMNFENKVVVFISLLAILLIFGVLALRIVQSK